MTLLNAHPAHNALPPATRTSAEQGTTEYLSFRLGEVSYAVDILWVKEIRSFEAPTPIAHAPRAISGVINLRGEVVPIVDLRLQLKAGEAKHDASTVVIVAAIRQRTVGLVVDAVSDVVELRSDELRAPPDYCATAGTNVIQQIALIQRPESAQMLVLLDLQALMRSPDLQLLPASSEASALN